jgi:hypothetical protein
MCGERLVLLMALEAQLPEAQHGLIRVPFKQRVYEYQTCRHWDEDDYQLGDDTDYQP